MLPTHAEPVPMETGINLFLLSESDGAKKEVCPNNKFAEKKLNIIIRRELIFIEVK
jgi:hypothetical protein